MSTKSIPILFLFFFLTNTTIAQNTTQKTDSLSKASFTVGLLQGGGSLVGFDVEALISDRFGVQVGAGLFGYGAGINIHLEPSIRSHYMSLQYWHQGLGGNFVQSVVGVNFVFRGKKWFTFQAGTGVPTALGPGAPSNFEQPPIMLMYSVGAYFPL